MIDRDAGKEKYLNLNQYRNENNTHYMMYNCGGYALDTFSWYTPYEQKKYPLRQLFKILCKRYGELLAAEKILYILKKQLKKDFPQLKELCLSNLTQKNDIIALRLGYIFSEKNNIENEFLTEDDEFDFFENKEEDFYLSNFDFHFIKRFQGDWYSKCGSCPIERMSEKEEMILNETEEWYDFYKGKILLFTMENN